MLAVDLDEAAPPVGTTVALLGHQLEHLWSFTEKKPILFGHRVSTLELLVSAGYYVATAAHHTIIPWPCPSPQGKKSPFGVMVQPEAVNSQSRLVRTLKGGNYNGTVHFVLHLLYYNCFKSRQIEVAFSFKCEKKGKVCPETFRTHLIDKTGRQVKCAACSGQRRL